GLQNTEVQILEIGSLLSLGGIVKLVRFSKMLRQSRYNIVQTFFQDSTIYGLLAARLAGVPSTIVSIRDMLYWGRPFTFLVYRAVSRLARHVLVNSSAIKDKVSPFFNSDKIRVIHNGIRAA